MKANKTLFLSYLLIIGFAFCSCAQKKDPWTEKQLMAPDALAKSINSGNNKTYIFSIGPGALIKNSIDIGPAQDKANLDKLRAELIKLPQGADIVIYCGCCPFNHCPNIRPAFSLLQELKFTNAKLLNLSTNLRTDWIGKGYPVVE